ncbi:CD225/dispanin family protein [Rhodococcus sp. ABRD24]|uniref:CD225/dispanin family protein n=1 Tax=Rhodococcus sp. ABRD24 TaxID=2507582 RepID=UPI00103E9C1A|nr:CD225/dispanin family protein [Rhodococcus sp. ABRD24]QBJ97105.1 CD225/dispanin family protein [Rhodococcus sp. ABRD24]
MTASTPDPTPPPPSEPIPPAPSPQQPPPPPSNAGWAVAALVAFWPLAFAAFSNAFDVYPRWARGDFAGAQYASDRVRKLGQLSLWILGGILVLVAIAYIVMAAVWISHGGDYDDSWRRHGRMDW